MTAHEGEVLHMDEEKTVSGEAEEEKAFPVPEEEIKEQPPAQNVTEAEESEEAGVEQENTEAVSQEESVSEAIEEAPEESEAIPAVEEAAEAAETEEPVDAENAEEATESEETPEAAETEEAVTPVEDVEEATRVFDTVEAAEPENRLDGIRLVCELCEAVQAQVGRDGFHGGVRPDNISVQDGNVKLGNPLEHGVGEFTPQELEYMAPELFWDGSRSCAADVYSIGLVLYSFYNHGLMPFWPVDTDATPNIRASALQRRMNREEITPPASAGSELSAIILRALAFAPEERWNDSEELLNALSDCHEEQPMATDISAVLTAMTERSKRRNEKKNDLDSPFVSYIGEEDEGDTPVEETEEEPIPKVKVRRSAGRLPQVLVYIALGFAIVAIVLLLRRCVALDEEARVTPTPPVAVTKEPSGEEKVIGGVAIDEPEPVEEPAETPTPTPEPTPAPVGKVEYIAVRENVSWTQAVQRCEEMGGVLAMPTNYEEFQAITAKCEEVGLTFVWLNARRNSDGKWVNDKGTEDAFFFAWGDGEPSEMDSGDGAAEDYFLLWNHNGRWSGNDSRENPLISFSAVYGGKIGFVCKTVTYESVNITDIVG